MGKALTGEPSCLMTGLEGLEYWGANFPAGTRRRTDVDATLFASTSVQRHVTTRFLINQCQIITFLILKSDITENSRIDLKGIVCKYVQIKLKLHLLLFYPSTWCICDFFLFHIEIEGKYEWIIWGGGGGGGGGQRLCWPPTLKLLGGLAPPLPTPMKW